MKKVIFTFLLLAICVVSSQAQDNKAEAIQKLTEGIISYSEGDLSIYSPISSFNKLALEKADKSVVLTKENIAGSLTEAKNYSHCIITVSTHTIVKVTDLNKTVMSGSWGCKMPFGQGYIQKGTLNFKEDYINNIIGIPNSQRRMMFLFK